MLSATKFRVIGLATLIMCAVTAGPATADWNPGDPHKMHFPQLPDLSPDGRDVMANYPYQTEPQPFGKVIADDWGCTESGPVTDIHIWGSWLNDVLPRDPETLQFHDPSFVEFHLSIYKDIPAGLDPEMPWSHPGQRVWDRFFPISDPDVRVATYVEGVDEQFYDPNIEQDIGPDTKVYQYNFNIDSAEAFEQVEGEIYWLAVQGMPSNAPLPAEQAVFGWKTSKDHFHDFAVFGDNLHPGEEPVPILRGEPWMYMEHPLVGPLDQAFVITPEPGTFGLAGLALAGLLVLRFRRRRT